MQLSLNAEFERMWKEIIVACFWVTLEFYWRDRAKPQSNPSVQQTYIPISETRGSK